MADDMNAPKSNAGPKSKGLFERAQAVIPGGVGSAIQFWPPYPIFVKDSQGAYVWDLDGNKLNVFCTNLDDA